MRWSVAKDSGRSAQSAGETLTLGDPPITVQVRRKKNARRLTLRLGAHGVFLTVPPRMSTREAYGFLAKQETWLREKLSDRPSPHNVFETGMIPIAGEPRRIITGSGRVPCLDGETLALPGGHAQHPAKLKVFLKELAREQLTEASDRYAAALGASYAKITLRDTRSRWGSCTASGNLMYSWRLIMAPPSVLDYVAAHEVAHLKELNHSKAYWAIVARLMPDYAKHRGWLRQHGAGLHLIKLDP